MLGRMYIAGGKLPRFTKEMNCLIVMYKLDVRYKNEDVAVRRLFSI